MIADYVDRWREIASAVRNHGSVGDQGQYAAVADDVENLEDVLRTIEEEARFRARVVNIARERAAMLMVAHGSDVCRCQRVDDSVLLAYYALTV